MQFLIDTHVFLWFVSGSKELSLTAENIIEERENEIFVSIANLWEISIKTALGKLNIEGDYASVINDAHENSFGLLPIDFAHTVEQNRLPFHHRDPFDRILISQAITENMSLISADAIFDVYLKGHSIERIW